MHTKNAELPSEKGGHDRRVRGAGVQGGMLDKQALYNFLGALDFRFVS